MHSTNLLKGFLIRTAVITCFLTAACHPPAPSENTFPLLGRWRVMAVENRESRLLDSTARKIYQQEVDNILDSARLNLSPDSAYQLQLGGDRETGHWQWDPQDSILRLEPQRGKKAYYKIHALGRQHFVLKKEMDLHAVELEIVPLPH